MKISLVVPALLACAQGLTISDYAGSKGPQEGSENSAIQAPEDLPDLEGPGEFPDVGTPGQYPDVEGPGQAPEVGSPEEFPDPWPNQSSAIKAPELGSIIEAPTTASTIEAPELGSIIETTGLASAIETTGYASTIEAPEIASTIGTTGYASTIRTTGLASTTESLARSSTIEPPTKSPASGAPKESSGSVKQYIVVMKAGHKDEEYKAHDTWVSSQVSELKKRGELDGLPEGMDENMVPFEFLSLKGYAGHMTPALLDDVKKDPLVDFVEEDSMDQAEAFEDQLDAPWGLARLSQREKVTQKNRTYTFDPDAGKGVTAYVIDSGVKIDHEDFEGRATWGKAIYPEVEADESGHGTHVAGTLGGKTYGVAKSVNIVAIRTQNVNGTGPGSGSIKGLEFAVKEHKKRVAAKDKDYKGAVVNMSLGSAVSKAKDLAVSAAVAAGLHVVVAAGNQNKDACTRSPARSEDAITVGATTIGDEKASFSNWGKCVDIQAPGHNIISAGIKTTFKADYGTSMATPHVAGMVAYFLSKQADVYSKDAVGAPITPADMKRVIKEYATADIIKGLDEDSPNLLAYTGGREGVPEF